VADINPALLRLIAYQLYTNGVDMKSLYKASRETIPAFLYQLEKFPLTNLLILLKYNLPSMIDGNLFFTYSMDKVNTESAPPSNLNWFDFCLSICQLLRIDLNQLNGSSNTTALSIAVTKGDLYATQTLLKHRADPNITNADGTTPLQFAVHMLNTISASRKQYLHIIRELCRYGARVNKNADTLIDKSEMSATIEQFVLSGKNMQPAYHQLNRVYFKLDQLEDLSAIAKVNPELINDGQYLDEVGEVNLKQLQYALKVSESQTKLTDKYILTWPYYIDQTVLLTCPVEPDDRPVVDPPPGPQQVYEAALANLPDLPKAPQQQEPLFLVEPTPDQSYYNASYSLPEVPMSPVFSLVPKMPLFNFPPLPSLVTHATCE
jgi:hypothetical protein